MTKRYNESWHKVEYSSYGTLMPIVNKDKNYTLLYNSDGSEQYVVAYAYCEEDNSWGQGHYFSNFYSALEYMFAPDYEETERRVYISNVIPSDWFDASELVGVVDKVFDELKDVPEIEEGHVIDVLKRFGYCD